MSEINDGGPAFPRPYSETNPARGEPEYEPGQSGMTLRDWFAGQALAGLSSRYGDDKEYASWVNDAYEFADAMLRAREAT